MPAPATGSRHLYTGHHQDSMQSASWLRARPQGAPLSRDFRPAPVLMSAFYGFDASAVVHTCSSSRRTPRPAPGGTFPHRSRPRLLTDAACGGLGPPTARRSRRTYLHHWHSTVHDGDHLPHVTPLSGHTKEPEDDDAVAVCYHGDTPDESGDTCQVGQQRLNNKLSLPHPGVWLPRRENGGCWSWRAEVRSLPRGGRGWVMWLRSGCRMVQVGCGLPVTPSFFGIRARS